jgi:hypothetical protein
LAGSGAFSTETFPEEASFAAALASALLFASLPVAFTGAADTAFTATGFAATTGFTAAGFTASGLAETNFVSGFAATDFGCEETAAGFEVEAEVGLAAG